jgi:hypothetical protein
MAKRNFYGFILFSFTLFIGFAVPATCEVPPLLHYEGILADAGNVTVPDGAYEVVFTIYDVPSGGEALWTEPWTSATSLVTTRDGRFSVMLGSIAPILASFFQDHPTTYLGIRIGSDSEMLPRQRISSVAYAFQAGNGVPSGGIIMWSGYPSEIPPGWAICDGANGTPDLRNRFIVGAGDEYGVGTQGGARENSLSHNHTIPSQGGLSTDTQGAHAHTFDVNTQGPGGSDSTDKAQDWDGSGSDYDTVASEAHIHHVVGGTSNTGSHAHVTGSHDHGGFTGNALSNTVENRPPFFSLCFIMKL